MTDTPKKPSGLKQRVLTALVLIPVLIIVLVLGGWFAAVIAALCLAVALYEQLNTLKNGGYRPVWWPAFAALAAGVVMVPLKLGTLYLALVVALVFCVLLCVMCRREDPKFADIMGSVLPVGALVLPGVCLTTIAVTQPRQLQLLLLLYVFATAIGCDTLAYFVGSALGGPKLCPHISPKKTVSGAVGGLLGSVLFALLVDLGFRWLAADFMSGVPLWHALLLGLICGVAAQMGDLFASMLKRHCSVKDFGNIFPGHGGMMDRLDSVLFTSIIVFAYRAILLGLF